MNEHISEAKKYQRTYKDIWINQLFTENRRPQVRIICQRSIVDTEEYFIHFYKAQGMILFNMTHNGKNFRQGGKPVSQDDIEQMRESLGLPFTSPLL